MSSFPSNFESFFTVMRHDSSVLSDLNLYMLWTKQAQQNTNFQTFDCSHKKLNKFLKSFLKPRTSFPLNFVSPFSLVTYNYSKVFQFKHYMLWTKRAYQCTTFQSFECSNESSPKSSRNFWNQKFRVYSNFASLLSIMFSALYFFGANFTYFLQK